MRDVMDGELLAAVRESAPDFFRTLIAREGGVITFERFMREALYHAQHGYYARRVRTIGRAGDFSTSATLHGALAQAVAAWASDRRSLLTRKTWHLIELGGGNGRMADTILHGLGWWGRRGVAYHIVERSETLRREQRELLTARSMVRWHDEIDTALEAARGEALIISNEFVDAFPCVCLEKAHGTLWREVGVGWNEAAGGLVEHMLPPGAPGDPADGLDSSALEPGYAAALAFGQRIEWHREYAHWLKRWNPLWLNGAMLTIDYGDQLPGLYHRRRTGTMRGYFRHLCCIGRDIYARPGSQDLTADVNFTDLLRWSRRLGLVNTGLASQAEFIKRWIPPGDARRYEREPAYVFLVDEAGAGTAFKVFEQQRLQTCAPPQKLP